MKAVLLALHPQWVKEIFVTKRKTIEVRKTRPKLEMPFTVYVYQTKHKGKSIVSDVLNSVYGGGKVIGSFVCDRIEEFHEWQLSPSGSFAAFEEAELCRFLKESRLAYNAICKYREGMPYYKPLYGWHITEPKLFDKPRELLEFWLYNDELNKRYERDENFCCYDGTDENGEATTDCDGENINNCYRCWEEWSGFCYKLTRPPQAWCYVEGQE